jgi:hypothetical protein
MKTLIRLPLFVCILVPALYAQTETFDIVTFIRPAGWTRTETNGILLLETRRQLSGRVEFCQIYIFPSVLSGASPEANFQQDWDAHMVSSLGIQARPSPHKEATTEGWIAVIGYADAARQGVSMRAMLVTVTGVGHSISFMVIVSPNAYQSELDKFFLDANLNADRGTNSRAHSSRPANSSTPEASMGGPYPASGAGLENYRYETPPSWTAQQTQQGIVLMSPMYPNGERCQLTLLPMRTTSAPLANEALGLFGQVFRADPLETYPTPPARMARGVSPQGWEYFSMRKLVGGQEGEARAMGATLLVARVDTQLATIIGTSKDFLVSACFGELDGDAWPGFLAGLQFRNGQASNQVQAGIRQRLAGTWITATGSVGHQYVFLANGRYQGAHASQYRNRISNSTVQETTNAYFGDGAYSFEGNNLVLTGDDHNRSIMSFRLEQVSKDSGQTWTDELCTLDPGATGEICYRRE